MMTITYTWQFGIPPLLPSPIGHPMLITHVRLGRGAGLGHLRLADGQHHDREEGHEGNAARVHHFEKRCNDLVWRCPRLVESIMIVD